MRRTRSGVVSVLCCAVLLSACDSSTGSDKSITLSLATNTVSLSQGGSAQIAVTIQRNNFEEVISLSVDDPLPQGVTATFSPAALPAGATSALLNIAAAGNATPTSGGAFTVRAGGQGISDQTQAIDVSVAVTGAYTLGVFQPTLRIAQGGGGDATVLVTRSGGNAADVSIVLSGLPAGVTAASPGSPTTAAATSVFFTAAPSVAVGTYPVTVTSSSPGVTGDQTTELSLEVIAPLPTAAATVRPFCASATWFAFKNEGQSWQQVTSTGTTFSFQATERLILAYVLAGPQQLVIVDHVSRPELDAMATADCGGERSLTGSVAGLTAGQIAFVAMGRSYDVPDATTASFALNQVDAGPLDLVATRGVVTETLSDAFLTPDRTIIRRAVDVASGATLPELNFTTAESFALNSINLSVGGLAADRKWNFQSLLRTSTTALGLLHSGSPVGTTTTAYVVPPSQSAPGDLHEFTVHGYQPDRSAGEIVLHYAGSPADRTVNLGPPLATPVVTPITTAPYVRLQGRLTVQNEYASMAQFTFRQNFLTGERRIIVAVTSGYLGGTPSSEWSIVVPDLSSVRGFNTTWMLAPEVSTDFLAESFSSTYLVYRGTPVDGDSHASAYFEGSIATNLSYAAYRLRAASPLRPAVPRRHPANLDASIDHHITDYLPTYK